MGKIHIAAKNGNLSEVKSLLSPLTTWVTGISPDEKYANGSTPLQLAVLHGHLDIVQYLVMNHHDKVKTSQLTTSHSSTWDRSTLASWWDKKTNATPPKAQQTLLHLAAEGGHLEVLEYLIDRCYLDKNAKDGNGETFVFPAARKNHLSIVKKMSITDAFYQPNKQGHTLIIESANHGSWETVKYLLRWFGIEQHQDLDGNTLLSIATIQYNLEIVKYLHGKGAKLNHQNKAGNTPLLLTILHPHDRHELLFPFGSEHPDYSDEGVDLVKYFAEKDGSLLDIRNKNGKNIFDVLQEKVKDSARCKAEYEKETKKLGAMRHNTEFHSKPTEDNMKDTLWGGQAKSGMSAQELLDYLNSIQAKRIQSQTNTSQTANHFNVNKASPPPPQLYNNNPVQPQSTPPVKPATPSNSSTSQQWPGQTSLSLPPPKPSPPQLPPPKTPQTTWNNNSDNHQNNNGMNYYQNSHLNNNYLNPYSNNNMNPHSNQSKYSSPYSGNNMNYHSNYNNPTNSYPNNNMNYHSNYNNKPPTLPEQFALWANAQAFANLEFLNRLSPETKKYLENLQPDERKGLHAKLNDLEKKQSDLQTTLNPVIRAQHAEAELQQAIQDINQNPQTKIYFETLLRMMDETLLASLVIGSGKIAMSQDLTSRLFDVATQITSLCFPPAAIFLGFANQVINTAGDIGSFRDMEKLAQWVKVSAEISPFSLALAVACTEAQAYTIKTNQPINSADRPLLTHLKHKCESLFKQFKAGARFKGAQERAILDAYVLLDYMMTESPKDTAKKTKVNQLVRQLTGQITHPAQTVTTSSSSSAQVVPAVQTAPSSSTSDLNALMAQMQAMELKLQQADETAKANAKLAQEQREKTERLEAELATNNIKIQELEKRQSEHKTRNELLGDPLSNRQGNGPQIQIDKQQELNHPDLPHHMTTSKILAFVYQKTQEHETVLYATAQTTSELKDNVQQLHQEQNSLYNQVERQQRQSEHLQEQQQAMIDAQTEANCRRAEQEAERIRQEQMKQAQQQKQKSFGLF